jgi:hypothetical protein
MRRLRSPIHKTDIARAWKYARAIGIPNPSIKIDRQRTVTIIPGKPEEVGQNEWDSVLRNDPPAA